MFRRRVYTGSGAGEAPDHPDEAGRESYVDGTSGHAYAIDHASGEILWSFQVVEKGFWRDPDLNSGGALWYPPGIDTETGMTLWGTGNPAPFPGTMDYPNAESRPAIVSECSRAVGSPSRSVGSLRTPVL